MNSVELENEKAPPSKTLARRAGAACVWLCVLASSALAVGTGAAHFARLHWTFDLVSHFPVQLALAALPPLLFLLCARRWKLAGVPLLVVAINVARILPFYWPAEQAAADGMTYRAVSASVLSSNSDHPRFLDFIRTNRPDFFLVVELNESWREDLRSLEREYPYAVVRTREDNFGMGLFSRKPIVASEVHVGEESELPTIAVTIELGESHLTVAGAHPLPPMGPLRSDLRNRDLNKISELVAQAPGPKLVLGDLNITSWSPYFQDFLHDSRLRDARRGFGVQPSWPDLPWIFRIPIDHTLVSNEVNVVDRSLGPDIGSDHLPVMLTFQLAP